MRRPATSQNQESELDLTIIDSIAAVEIIGNQEMKVTCLSKEPFFPLNKARMVAAEQMESSVELV